MGNKDYLLKILGEIKDIWPQANSFIVLINAGGLDDDSIMRLIRLLDEIIEKNTLGIEQGKIESMKTYLKKISIQEKNERLIENHDDILNQI